MERMNRNLIKSFNNTRNIYMRIYDNGNEINKASSVTLRM